MKIHYFQIKLNVPGIGVSEWPVDYYSGSWGSTAYELNTKDPHPCPYGNWNYYKRQGTGNNESDIYFRGCGAGWNSSKNEAYALNACPKGVDWYRGSKPTSVPIFGYVTRTRLVTYDKQSGLFSLGVGVPYAALNTGLYSTRHVYHHPQTKNREVYYFEHYGPML